MDETSVEANSSTPASLNNGADNASVSSGSNHSSNDNDEFFFGKYGRHVPRVLRHQIISKLVNQYIYKLKTTDDTSATNRVNSKQGDPGVDFKANTSIYRFHCALLFVDISGFTVLSQKLKVDDLKNQINAYFQKIVDIINKYDGEIIKFAGDALFIIWQTKVNDTSDPRFLVASKDAADKAVTCGMEINTECSNYAITLKNPIGDSKKVNDLLETINTSHNLFEGTKARHATQAAPPPGHGVNGTPPRGGGSGQGKRKRREPTVTYLNVHAGVSMGVMAGLDVGANDRFEYLLLGRPMNEVAIAEGDAGTGEIVISPAVHDLLHNFSSLKATGRARSESNQSHNNSGSNNASGSSDGGGGGGAVDDVPASSPRPLSCGCTRTPSGFYKIRNTLEDMLCVVDFGAQAVADQPHSPSKAHTICVVPAAEEFEGNRDLQYEFETYAQVIEELMAGYRAISPTLLTQFSAVIAKLAAVVPGEGDAAHSPKGHRAAIEYTEKEVMMEHFFGWAQHCLLDDIARHVHEVMRKGFSFYQENRAAPFEAFLNSPAAVEQFRAQLEKANGGLHRHSTARHMSMLTTMSGSASTSAVSQQSAHSSVSSHTEGVSAHSSRSQQERSSGRIATSSISSHSPHYGGRAGGDSFVSKMRQLTGIGSLREKKLNKHHKVLSKDGALVSELRNVIVLFISVKIANSVLFLDPARDTLVAKANTSNTDGGDATIQTCKVDSFHFLTRTIQEINADKKLINQFQSCMEVMTDVFHAKGGQMRQFIVDDKGTVCIGTFGLRGSVNYDNAAAAVDAADLIVARLQLIGFNASVGVTSGAAYCGLVGSDTRHEYAVMGPSTNLSARLMGRAQEGEIICDSAIRQRDRAHSYASLGAVKAKGYTNLVPIFKPEFVTKSAVVTYTPSDVASPRLSLTQPSDTMMEPPSSTSKVYGRKKEAIDIFKFLFHDTVKGELDELVDAFWKPAGVESAHKTAQLLHGIPHHDYDSPRVQGGSSKKKRKFILKQSVQNGRFDISRKMKKTVVISPNGMGKTALLNLVQYKLDALVRKNKEIYNIAVFRHQVGYINTTALFSAWYCLIRQTLYSIAEAVAAECTNAQEAAEAAMRAMKEEDFAPIIELLTEFLPAELRPFTPLLSFVGIAAKAPDAATEGAASNHEDVISDGETGLVGAEQLGGEDGNVSPPDSGKTDPVSTLDPGEKLRLCADLIVAIVQLHVKLTRKVTVYIMDDLQQHDPASQDLGRVLVRTVTGVCLVCTFRTSQTYSSLSGDPSQQALSPSLVTQVSGPARLFDGTGFTSYEHAMMSLPVSNEFHRTELRPLSKPACKQLLGTIFSNFGVTDVQEEILDSLHTLSTGSPLYATELAKSVCDTYVHRVCTVDFSSGAGQQGQPSAQATCSFQLSAIIDSFRTDRIEEIVHFRFDKLTEQCQLVLKMAAVASVSGSHFTLSMLTYIVDSSDNSESAKLDAMVQNTKMLLGYLSDPDAEEEGAGGSPAHRNSPLHSSMDLVQAINDLLESDEFIEFRGDVGSGATASGSDEEKSAQGVGRSYSTLMQQNAATPVTPKPDLNRLMNETSNHMRAGSRDRGALQQLRFHWKVDMELRAIYDLMLDEQKESLHDRVASFLEQEMEKRDESSATEWVQLAFHWERATNWSSAMTCYYQSGMLLRDQGDSQGCKTCFTEAFRMLDKMRSEAGVPFLQGSALRGTADPAFPTTLPSSADCGASAEGGATGMCDSPVSNKARAPWRTEEELRALTDAGIEYILNGRNSKVRPDDVYKMFEGNSLLFTTGLSVLVRLAQTLIGAGTSELAFQLFEDALDIVHVLRSSPTLLMGEDGEPFGLVEKSICFSAISGMMLLLMNDQVNEASMSTRCVALITLMMQLAKSKPEYEVHLVHAHVMKIRLMEFFMHKDPGIVTHILRYTDGLMKLYNREKHSRDLIYHYNSDRVASAVGVAVKVLCLQGRFAECVKYIDYARSQAAKLKRFFSHAMGLLGIYSPVMLYFPDTQAQLMFDKFMQDAHSKQSADFQEMSPLLVEGIAQVLKLAQYETTRDENIFESDSMSCESFIHSRALVQARDSKFIMNILRFQNTAVEFVAARVCFLKALRHDMLQYDDAKRAAEHRAKVVSYLNLGLELLTFLPEQTSKNETYFFSDLHEKLLRAQLLMKLIEYTDDDHDSSSRSASSSSSGEGGGGVGGGAENTEELGCRGKKCQLWHEALDNLLFCAEIGKRGEFHGIVLQTGAHMQALGRLCVEAPPSSTSKVTAATANATASGGSGGVRGAAPSLCDADSRCELRAQGEALQQDALQFIREHNTEGVDLDAIFNALLIRVK